MGLIKFPDGKEVGCLDYSTISYNVNAYTKGNLNGFVNDEFAWPWVIPDSAPTGKYEFLIRVHNYLPLHWKTRLRVRIILWIRVWISSIDPSVLARPGRQISYQKITTVIVNERGGPSVQKSMS